MSRIRIPLLAAAALAIATPALAYDNGLVRIEPRPYYGAVVSIENGVRVFRGLPAQRLMIINPDKSPISLSFNRTIEHRAAEGGGYSGGGADSGAGYSGVGGFAGYADGGRGFHGGKRGRGVADTIGRRHGGKHFRGKASH